ncbi:hypothetical protein E1B28_005283 [Marasmius oreades]|uniref:MYND-type domain-containing protein n=1 Tax=Marasmius oreades TaxID=181124 RepID=A0A9P7V0D0_9AGAR|nr:uncharacterized protein E1B28_005283 [Marasmius oreades]KAG7097973.1 hypothetical protein E1B28_005283 [Marasmius oreades]
MARPFGPEALFNQAGFGIVSQESLKNQRIADDLCARRKPNEAVPYIMKAMQDENNVDIFVTATFLEPTYKESIECLDEGKRRASAILRRKYGPKALADDGPLIDKFSWNLDTRPYMRIMQAYVRMHVEYKKYAAAVDTIIEIFRLNRNDPLGQSTWLGSLLCFTARYADALYFAQVFMDVGAGRMHLDDLPPGGGTKFLPPRRDLYTAEEQRKLKNYEATILYTAALASFKLWGDGEEARMYLRLAAGANPKVLVKLLGRIRKPEHLTQGPRGINGPESAHDYLWLSQDLWMEDDVWSWISENLDAKKSVLMECGSEACNKEESTPAQFHRCSGCRQISYCSRECQKLDWRRHKPDCTHVQAVKAVGRAVAAGKPVPADVDMPIFTGDFSTAGVYMQEVPKTTKKANKKKKKKKKGKKEAGDGGDDGPIGEAGEDEAGKGSGEEEVRA